MALPVDDLHLGHGADFEILHPLVVEDDVVPHHFIGALQVGLGPVPGDVETLPIELLGVGAALAGVPARVGKGPQVLPPQLIRPLLLVAVVQFDRPLQRLNPLGVLGLPLVAFELPLQIDIGRLLAGQPLVQNVLLEELLPAGNRVGACRYAIPYSGVFPCRRPSYNRSSGAHPATARPRGSRTGSPC